MAWFALLILTSVVSQMVGADFKDKLNGGHSESQQAQDLLRANFPSQAGDSTQVVFRTDTPISDPANTAKIDALVTKLEALPHVAAVQSPTVPAGRFQISQDGHIAYATGAACWPTRRRPTSPRPTSSGSSTSPRRPGHPGSRSSSAVSPSAR